MISGWRKRTEMAPASAEMISCRENSLKGFMSLAAVVRRLAVPGRIRK
jgi:hypothetical protein